MKVFDVLEIERHRPGGWKGTIAYVVLDEEPAGDVREEWKGCRLHLPGGGSSEIMAVEWFAIPRSPKKGDWVGLLVDARVLKGDEVMVEAPR